MLNEILLVWEEREVRVNKLSMDETKKKKKVPLHVPFK